MLILNLCTPTRVQGENQELKRELAEIESEIAEFRDRLSVLKKEQDILKNENVEMRQAMPLAGNLELLKDFEHRKHSIRETSVQVDAFRKKHQQMSNAIKKYRRLLSEMESGGTASTHPLRH